MKKVGINLNKGFTAGSLTKSSFHLTVFFSLDAVEIELSVSFSTLSCWLTKTFQSVAKYLLSIPAVQQKQHASISIPAQQRSLLSIIKVVTDPKAMLLVVLGLWLRNGCCPLLERMILPWLLLKASLP